MRYASGAMSREVQRSRKQVPSEAMKRMFTCALPSYLRLRSPSLFTRNHSSLRHLKARPTEHKDPARRRPPPHEAVEAVALPALRSRRAARQRPEDT